MIEPLFDILDRLKGDTPLYMQNCIIIEKHCIIIEKHCIIIEKHCIIIANHLMFCSKPNQKEHIWGNIFFFQHE